MKFFEDWVEQDLNPIITFSSTSKILYTNSEAQFLLNKIKQKELYELALNYAPKSFGVKTSYIDLNLHNYTFYAITVKYDNEDEIHIKLYKSTMTKKEPTLNIKNINSINIFTLIDLAISTNKIKSSTSYKKNYDPSIPEFKLDASSFIKTLSQIFEAFKGSSKINCSVFLKTGEYIKIEEKKYSLITVEVTSNKDAIKEILEYKEDSSFILTCHKNKICIDLPLVV